MQIWGQNFKIQNSHCNKYVRAFNSLKKLGTWLGWRGSPRKAAGAILTFNF